MSDSSLKRRATHQVQIDHITVGSDAPVVEIRARAAALGGHATLFRARDKAVASSGLGVFTPLKAPLDRIHQELKQAFDPDGVFNPGRLYPGL